MTLTLALSKWIPDVADAKYAWVAGLVLVLVAILVWRLRHRTLPEDEERARRKWIHSVGRITDGTVLDAHEVNEKGFATQLVVFRYDVSGVSYESSQDVTRLRHRVDLHSCRTGLPAAVKYDPQNPGKAQSARRIAW